MLKKVLLDFDYYEDLLSTQKKYQELQKNSKTDKEGHGLLEVPKVPEKIDIFDKILPSTSQETSVPEKTSTNDDKNDNNIEESLSPKKNISISRIVSFIPKKAIPKTKKLLRKFDAIGIEIKNNGDIFVNGLLFSQGNGISLLRHFVSPKKKIPTNFEAFLKLLNDHGIERESTRRSDRETCDLPKPSQAKYWWWLGNV